MHSDVDMARRRMVIIGAGGFAREVADLVADINKENQTWDLLGFIDEDAGTHGRILNGVPVLGDFSVLTACDVRPVEAVCAVGNPQSKRVLVKKAVDSGLIFTNLIHPAALISPSVTMGVGNIICAGNMITTNVVVGDHVGINPGCGIGHDAVLGDYSTILWGVNISGNVKVGVGCAIGSKTVIIQRLQIGEWSTIGAGAVVVRDLPANCTAVGIPAKPIKFHWWDDNEHTGR